RSDLQRKHASIRQVQDIVVEFVMLVPEADAAFADIIHCLGNVEEVFKDLSCDILVNGIVLRKFERNPHQVQRIHSHPACAICLIEKSAGRQRRASIEYANVVETKKAALENIHA